MRSNRFSGEDLPSPIPQPIDYKDNLPLYRKVDKHPDFESLLGVIFEPSTLRTMAMLRAKQLGQPVTIGDQYYQVLKYETEENQIQYVHEVTSYDPNKEIIIESQPISDFSIRNGREAFENSYDIQSIHEVRGYFVDIIVRASKPTREDWVNIYVVLKDVSPEAMQKIHEHLIRIVERSDTPEIVSSKITDQFGPIVHFIATETGQDTQI